MFRDKVTEIVSGTSYKIFEEKAIVMFWGRKPENGYKNILHDIF